MNVPAPGPKTDQPYAPQPILQGGIVVPLWPGRSPYLNKDKVTEREVYGMSRAAPGRISGIHNPSIELHTVKPGINTGVAAILAAGGGHKTLNVGKRERRFSAVHLQLRRPNTIILRNGLRRDGCPPQTDEVFYAQPSIRLMREHVKELNIDLNKIGIIRLFGGRGTFGSERSAGRHLVRSG